MKWSYAFFSVTVCNRRAFAILGGDFATLFESIWVCKWLAPQLSCTKDQMLQKQVTMGTPKPFEVNGIFTLTSVDFRVGFKLKQNLDWDFLLLQWLNWWEDM